MQLGFYILGYSAIAICDRATSSGTKVRTIVTKVKGAT